MRKIELEIKIACMIFFHNDIKYFQIDIEVRSVYQNILGVTN